MLLLRLTEATGSSIFVNYNQFLYQYSGYDKPNYALDVTGPSYVNAWFNYWSSPYAPNSIPYQGQYTGICYVSDNVDYSFWVGKDVSQKYYYGIDGGYSPLGIYSKTVSDLLVTTPGIDTDFSRTYNSLNTASGSFGKGWTFGFEGSCKSYQYEVTNPDGSVSVKTLDLLKVITLPNGSTLSFTCVNGQYISNDSKNKLTQTADGGFSLTTKNLDVYTFNPAGYLNGVVDANGNAIRMTVDATGHVTTVQDSAGRVYNISYNADGTISSITDPLGRSISYTYANGLLTDVRNSLNQLINHYDYDADGFLCQVVNGAGEVEQGITYDKLAGENRNKVLTLTDAQGNIHSLVYDTVARTVTTTDSTGRTGVEWYTDAYQIIKSQDAEGRISEASYADPDGNVTSTKDRNGNVISRRVDHNGNILSVTKPDGTTESNTYDQYNNILSGTDAAGHTTYYRYDACKNLILKAQPLNGTDVYADGCDESLFAITRYVYYSDAESAALGYRIKGLLKQVIDPNGGATVYTYDEYGNVNSVTDPEGNKSTISSNVLGWRISSTTAFGYTTYYDYDVNGRPVRITDAGGGVVRMLYDLAGRNIQKISPNQYNASADGLTRSANDTSYSDSTVGDRCEYDSHGNLIAKTDAAGNITRYSYDLYGNQITKTLPNGAVYSYSYDVMNRQTEVFFRDTPASAPQHLYSYAYAILSDGKTQKTTTQYLNATETAVTVTTSDYGGRVVSEVSADGTTTSASYNPDGTISITTRANGGQTYFKYDALKRPTEMWVSIDATHYAYTAFKYDSKGNVLEKKSGVDPVLLWEVPAKFVTMTSVYDRNGRVKSISDSSGARTDSYYDADGRLSRVEQYVSSGSFITTEYTYNYLGKQETIVSHVRAGDIAGHDPSDDSDLTLTTRQSYDLNGNLLSLTSPDGTVIYYSYDELNRQTGSSTYCNDEFGRLTTFEKHVTYTWDGQVATSTDANGNVTGNEYDNTGRLIRTIDAAGGITARYYDIAGRLIAIVSPNQYDSSKTLDQMGRTEYLYDVMGRVKTVTQVYFDPAAGQWVSFVEKAYIYDAAGNVIREEDALGYASGTGDTIDQRIASGYGKSYSYDLAGHILTALDPVSADRGLTFSAKHEYDALGRKIRAIDADGNSIYYDYSDAGKIRSAVWVSADENTSQMIEANGYDLLGHVTTHTDANHHVTLYEYNALGKVSQITVLDDQYQTALVTYYQYDNAGRVSRMWTSAGLLETYTYDSLGRTLSKTQSATDGSQAITLLYSYDKNGNLRFSTDGNGNITETTYDSLNRATASSLGGKTSTVSYDSNGNVLAKTDWLGNKTTNTYDSLNRLILVTDAYNHTVMKYTYDLNNRQITAINALDQTTSYQYDKNNRLLKTIDPAGDSKSQTYNNQGSQDSATDGLGNTTHYTYDGQGRLIRVTLPNGETTTYTYDNAGNVLNMTDAAGNVTTYEYNYANLLTRLIRAGGRTGEPGSFVYDFSKITSYTYTSDGRVSTMTDRNGAVTVCVYDIHGNLLSRTVTEGATTQSVSYTYDSNGNVLTMTDGTGTTTRTYDVWNRTTTKTVPDIGTAFYTYDITDGFDAGCSAESTVDPKGNVTVKVYDRVGRLIYVLPDSMTTSYAYYADGSLQSVVYGNGSCEDYTYTADKLLKTLVIKAIDGTIIDSYEYTYDAAHNLLSKTDSKGATGYTYDAQNRILTVTEPSGKITAYTYDAAGNRSSMTETEGTDVTATVYTYDALNRLVRTSETLNGTLARTVDYAYDNNGNLLTVTSTTYTDGIAGEPVLEQNNTYDLLNQLIRTVTSDGTTVENTYNGDGYRVVKSVNGSATRFLYQYDKIVLELNALGDQTGRNVYGLNLISRTFGEDTFFYFYNGHADVTALLASDGTIAATYYYDAFGNILDQTGTATSNILYAGYQYDPETGLYYLNARMYDPVTARFIQEDSYLGERNNALSLNLYTYCKNSPIRYSDPTGHNTQEDYQYQQDMFARHRKSSTQDAYDYQQDMKARRIKSSTLDAYEYQTRTITTMLKQDQIAKENKSKSSLIAAIGIGVLAVVCIGVGIATMGAAVPAEMALIATMASSGLIGAGIGLGMTEIQDLSDNGTIDAGFKTYAGAAVGGFVAGAVMPWASYAGSIGGSMAMYGMSSMAGSVTNQYISTGKVNVLQAGLTGATGALTGGIATMAPQTIKIVANGAKNIVTKLTTSSANATVSVAEAANANVAEVASANVAVTTEKATAEELLLNPVDDAMNAGASVAEVVEGGSQASLDGVRIINKKYADNTFNLSGDLAEKYPNGVNFTEEGFPDFSPYSTNSVQIQNLEGDAYYDFIKANQAAGYKTTPTGFTWHHVEDGTTLMLVPSDLHGAVRHTGGASLIRLGLRP